MLGGIVTEGVFANTYGVPTTRSRIVSVRSDSCERNSAMNGAAAIARGAAMSYDEALNSTTTALDQLT